MADSWVDEAAPTQVKGDDSALFVRSMASANRRSLVRFALPAAPAGCTVTTAATLSLYNQSPSAGRTIQVFAGDTTWTEATVNWNNQPATTGTAATSASAAAAGIQTWTVTSQVQAQYSGQNNGFVLRDQTEDNATSPMQNYRSREAGNTPPQLVITFG